jgi:phage terminase small subunit
MSTGLTPKQEKFVQGLVRGLSQRKAYINAGYSVNQSLDNIESKASNLLKNGKIWARYQELLEEGKKAAVLTLEQKRQILKKIATGKLKTKIKSKSVSEFGTYETKREETKVSDIIKAIELDNKMDPDFYALGTSKEESDDPLEAYFAETDAECDANE